MLYALDLETAPNVGDLSNGYALEPWRVRLNQAHISSIAIYGEDGFHVNLPHPSTEVLMTLLSKLVKHEVYAHNAVFDVAWLIATLNPDKLAPIPSIIKSIKWRDTQLLAKWVVNGRRADEMKVSYSLINLCSMFLKDDPGLEKFRAIKQNIVLDSSDEYWLRRGILDAEFTLKLAKFLLTKMPEISHRGYVIEARAIPQLANSWLIGLEADQDELNKADADLNAQIDRDCAELGVTREICSSPQQLGRLLFNDWGLQPLGLTATGLPQTDADSIKLIEYQTQDKRLIKLQKIRQSLTLLSKYVNTMHEALSRSGDGCLYAVPRMFGTVTGRLTYSNETLGNKVSIAAQQIPRKDKIIRKILRAPSGKDILRLDANAQESRIMAIWSNDQNMIQIFKNGMNFHSYMASNIVGRAYEEFMQAYDAGDHETNEQRQLGKLTNLSCNFRIGGKSLARKSFTEYDRWMTEEEGRKLVNLFKRTYPGIPAYWHGIIHHAKMSGYTYTIAHRRYKIPIEMLESSDAWKVEGTIISFPIQGTAAEQFYAFLSQVPDALVMTTMHDATYFMVDSKEEGLDIARRANQTPYQELWQLDTPLPVALPYDASFGYNFSDIK